MEEINVYERDKKIVDIVDFRRGKYLFGVWHSLHRQCVGRRIYGA